MTELRSDAAFAHLVAKHFPGYRLVRHWPLTGGISAETTAIEVAGPDDRLQRYVVRRHGEADRCGNPHIARDEFRLLQLLHEQGVPGQTPHAFDESGEILPTPYVVVEYVDGATELEPADPVGFAAQLADRLARIHSIDCARHDLLFLPHFRWALAQPPAGTDLAPDEARIHAALKPIWPLSERNRPVLLHGDFWPGNVLWKDGRLAAIIDWEDASRGDPLADVAIARMEILWACGVDGLASFTRRYQELSDADFTDLPCWDLFVALKPLARLGAWGLAPEEERSMRESLHWFIEQALTLVSERSAHSS